MERVDAEEFRCLGSLRMRLCALVHKILFGSGYAGLGDAKKLLPFLRNASAQDEDRLWRWGLHRGAAETAERAAENQPSTQEVVLRENNARREKGRARRPARTLIFKRPPPQCFALCGRIARRLIDCSKPRDQIDASRLTTSLAPVKFGSTASGLSRASCLAV